MTSSELVERALRRINPPAVDRVALRSAFLTVVEDALRLLPVKVREKFGGREAELYRKNFTVTLTGGEGSLSAHTNLTSEPMIPSEIVKVTHPNVVTEENPEGRLQYAGSRSALSQGRGSEFSHYTIEDNTLYTEVDGDTEALDGSAVVRAGFAPLISNVKFSHESLLVECLVELTQGAEVKTT